MDEDAGLPARARPLKQAVVIGGVALGAALVAIRLFPEAVPQVALRQQLTPAIARARADSFVRAHHLPAGHARTAVRFGTIDSLQVFLELGAGGKDTLASVLRGKDVSLFRWWVRYFTPGDPHEVRVRMAPDGRVAGFIRELANEDRRPALDSAAARLLADSVLAHWLVLDPAQWTLATSSYKTVNESDRLERTYTYERTDRKIAGAPLRLDVVIAGDIPSLARDYVVIPEAFIRRYSEMRASNELYAYIAAFGFPVYGLMALVALVVFSRRGLVRWRPALVAATAIAGLYAASMANEVPGSWFSYGTETPAGVFLTRQVIAVLVGPVFLALFLTVVLAGGEVLVRRAFPGQLDWWSLWRGRATREVAERVLSGYALCAVGFGYVSLFYYVTQRSLGWWVPSELLDDPNQIATPLPWVTAVALSLQAGVLEEVLFRAVPLSLLALWIKDHPSRRWVLGAGAVGTALVFGFAHANYESWPPYSRGVELFAEALLWAVIFLRYGLVTTVVSHFVYDLLLFGLFAAAGNAPAYRVTLGVVLLAAVTPALVVLVPWLRRRRLDETADDLRFGAWRPHPEADAGPATIAEGIAEEEAADAVVAPWAAAAPPEAQHDAVVSPPPRRRFPDVRLALVLIALALVFPARAGNVLGPRYTADRARVYAVADSVLRARGVDTTGWMRLAATESYVGGPRERFFRANDARAVERSLARSYRPAAAWRVRYVHRDGSLDRRAERWEVRVLADGAPLDVEHTIADSAPRPVATPAAVRAAAIAAVRAARIDVARLREVEFTPRDRPARRDVTIAWSDTAIHLPKGASARVHVDLAGAEPLALSREVELPEPFLRADAARRAELGVATAVSVIALAALFFGGTVWIVRRRPVLVDDRSLSTRGAVIAAAVCTAALVAGAVNGMPTSYADWDTATPWSSFVAMRWLTVALQAFAVVFVAALWLGADALRRRVGIPFRPAVTGDAGARDALLTGAALAALLFIGMRVGDMASTAVGAWDAPATHMAALIPVVGAAIDAVRGLFTGPVLVALPAMVMFGLSRRPGWRLIAPLLVAGLLIAPVVAAGDLIADQWALGALGVLVAVLVTAVPIVAWGRQSVAAWLAAWLAFGVLNDGTQALSAAAGADRMAFLVGAAVAAAGLVALWTWLRRGTSAA